MSASSPVPRPPVKPGRYLAVPAFRCHAAAKVVSCEQEARRHAQTAADGFRVAFVVWRVLEGRPVRLQAFPPARLEDV